MAPPQLLVHDLLSQDALDADLRAKLLKLPYHEDYAVKYLLAFRRWGTLREECSKPECANVPFTCCFCRECFKGQVKEWAKATTDNWEVMNKAIQLENSALLLPDLVEDPPLVLEARVNYSMWEAPLPAKLRILKIRTLVEEPIAEHTEELRGELEDGSSYSCVFRSSFCPGYKFVSDPRHHSRMWLRPE